MLEPCLIRKILNGLLLCGKSSMWDERDEYVEERGRKKQRVLSNSWENVACWEACEVPQLCLTLCDSMDYTVHGIYSSWNSPGQNTRVGSLSLLQGIYPTQGSNPGFLHCRQILYQLSHKGRPRILEWVAYPFSSGSSSPRNRTRISCIAGEFFTNWSIREALNVENFPQK